MVEIEDVRVGEAFDVLLKGDSLPEVGVAGWGLGKDGVVGYYAMDAGGGIRGEDCGFEILRGGGMKGEEDAPGGYMALVAWMKTGRVNGKEGVTTSLTFPCRLFPSNLRIVVRRGHRWRESRLDEEFGRVERCRQRLRRGGISQYRLRGRLCKRGWDGFRKSLWGG